MVRWWALEKSKCLGTDFGRFFLFLSNFLEMNKTCVCFFLKVFCPFSMLLCRLGVGLTEWKNPRNFKDPQNQPKEITVVLGVTREAVKSAKAGDIVSISVAGFMPKWTQTLVSHSKVSW